METLTASLNDLAARGFAIIHGDSRQIAPTFAGQAHLVYLDPCFATGKDHKTAAKELAFSDKFKPGEFEAYLRELFTAHKVALHPEHGAMVVHCDSSFQPLVRVILDGLFGREKFCDEIVWRYRRWPTKTRRLQRMHDYLIRYALNPKKARFVTLYDPPSASTLETWGTQKQKAVFRNGTRRRSIASEEQSPGVPMSDVWDIPLIAGSANERTGYPTQKPRALLERVISTFSLPGDLVLDGTMGSGTTLDAALRLGRRAVGIDQSLVATSCASERLGQCYLLR